MAAGLIVKMIGDKKVLAGIRAVTNAGKNPKEMLEKIVIIIQRATDLNFKSEGRPTPWQPSQRALAQSGQTLRDTDALHKSVSSHPIVKVGKNKLIYGTSKPQAPSMHFGFPPHGIPARPFLVITDDDKKKIETMMKSDFRQKWAVGRIAA